ncbi:N-acetylglucosamine-6-phosphate deacetylase [Trichococcus shcherbakoviae]|uniref:N-acetylglucosamine-6-phosphate deacetylase n=1 Tax=Trichococcus shcherbakoviae subsp. psychrophilus TaxID=2585775 RepID=A0A5C5E514_9LACT|nr:N-acetylglucosamine-6-phosphate deacetylase [Trichococcus shcherbakoviae]TNV68081.1 N-acetylglucosamine-6-phosphate deacetylase [Trichococcus shcherbakoviae subsp. psychrophilus]
MKKYVFAETFYFTDGEKGPGYLEITDGKFGSFTTEKPVNSEIIDYSGKQIAPGLVDTHIHGYKGQDVMDNDLKGLSIIAEGILSCGVTSFLPTTLTASTEQLDAVCATIGENIEDIKGAKIRGIFLEGPFFCEKYKGAQNPKYMGDPSIEKLANWQNLAKGHVKKIALAPERAGTLEFIDYATEHNIHTAIAHTEATYEQCKAAVEHGANIFVHTYNGMRGLHHREPGVVGAAITLKNVFDELICDGHHVHPVAAQVVMDGHGRDKTILVTDCMRGGGLGDSESMLGEFPVLIKDGAARLVSDGSLAGSVLELISAVRNVVSWGLATPAEAIKMASLVPAQSVGIADVCGQIAQGYAADFIVLDSNLELAETYLDGKSVYVKA